jgi:hypothetical protein
MNDIRAELTAKWRDAAASSPSGREWRGIVLAANCPLRLLAGIREPDERIALLLEASLIPAHIHLFRMQAEGVSVTNQRRPEEGIFRIAIVLELDELREVFEVLVEDVIDVASDGTTPAEAMALVVRRLEAWQACLRARRRRLSREEQIGLMGELLLLRMAGEDFGYLAAVDAWQGPLDGLHDFEALGIAIEVKSVLGIGTLLRIAPEDQIEPVGLSGLVIARPRFREDPAGQSLAESVAALRADIAQAAPAALSSFNDKMLRAGYVDGESDESPRVILNDLYGFEVLGSFPRIARCTVPAGVIDISYSIDERNLGEFRRDREAVRHFTRRMANGAP